MTSRKAALSFSWLIGCVSAWHFFPSLGVRTYIGGASLTFKDFRQADLLYSVSVPCCCPFLRVEFLKIGLVLVGRSSRRQAVLASSSSCRLSLSPLCRTLQVDHLVRRGDIFEEENLPQGAPKQPPAGGHKGTGSALRSPRKRLRRLSQVSTGELSPLSPSSPPSEDHAGAGSASFPTTTDAVVSLAPETRRAD